MEVLLSTTLVFKMGRVRETVYIEKKENMGFLCFVFNNPV